jgi:hypothetical protein
MLNCLKRLAVDNIKLKDPYFSTVHSRLKEAHFCPHFHDGTHILIVVPSSATIAYFDWHRDLQ